MEPDDKQPVRPPRQPYEPPKVEESATFEHLVLMCARTPSTPIKCGSMTRS
jgi:hypothetical protein